MANVTLPIIFSLLIIPGVFLVFIPFLPALTYMLIVALVFGVIDGFVHLSPVELAILGILTILSLIVDWGAGILGARYGGAHVKSIFWGIVGAVIGTFIFFPFGGLVGLFVAILLSGIYYEPDRTDRAVRSAAGALMGTALGMAVNAILAVLFFACFVLFIIF